MNNTASCLVFKKNSRSQKKKKKLNESEPWTATPLFRFCQVPRRFGITGSLWVGGGENWVGAKSCMADLEVDLSKRLKEIWTRFILEMI